MYQSEKLCIVRVSIIHTGNIMEHVTAPAPSAALGQNESAYTKETSSDGWTRFTIQPASGPRPFLIVWIFIVGIPWMLWLRTGFPFFVFFTAAMAFLYFVRFVKANNLSQKRQPGGNFEVGPQGLRLPDGSVIERANIFRLLSRNTLDGQAPIPSFVVHRGSFAGLSAVAQSAGAARLQRDFQAFVPLAYQLDIEHSGRSAFLAGGMTEATAHAVYVQVADILGLNDRGPA